MTHKMSNEQSRTLGFTVAFAMGLGTMIAAGIFSLSGTATARIGSSGIISFVIAALIAGITAWSYSEFASIYSESGGGYLFVSRTIDNEYATYVEGVMLFLGYSATTAFYLATAGEWVHEFIFSAIPPWFTGVSIAVLLGALNASGTEESGTFQVVVTAGKVIILLIFIGGAFMYKPASDTIHTFATSFSTDLPAIIEVASLAFITFFGFSAIAASAGEIKEPQRNVPKAIAASIITVTILYALVIIAMVNSPIPAKVVAQQGETAMGKVANAFLGPIGMKLIIAGAIFSMVSAANASILAASRIGYLMGKEGYAASRFKRIHPKYGTPHWAVGACTFTISALVIVFIGLFGNHGYLHTDLTLGLKALTGFANTNLLIPLSVVNATLIYSRYTQDDLERPVKVPLSPLLPAIGIAANIALLASLPFNGLVAGIIGIFAFLGIYLLWGGGISVEEMLEEAEPAEPTPEEPEEAFTIVTPLAGDERVEHALNFVDNVSGMVDRPVNLKAIHVEKVPEQVPSDQFESDTQETTKLIRKELQTHIESKEIDIQYSVTGYVSPRPASTIRQVALDSDADLLVMGYPTEHELLVQSIQRNAPCEVAYLNQNIAEADFESIVLGAGGGEHHDISVKFGKLFGAAKSKITLAGVRPSAGGTEEEIGSVTEEFEGLERGFEVVSRDANSVATGLIEIADEKNATLFIGVSRDSLLSQWLLGSTPDRVIDQARAKDIPVIVYGAESTVSNRISNWVFVLYRTVRSLL